MQKTFVFILCYCMNEPAALARFDKGSNEDYNCKHKHVF
jgi:hypothetical protein